MSKTKGNINIKLKGQSYKLKFTLGSLADLQDDFNNEPLDLIFARLEKLDIKAMLKLLYYGLKAENSDITEEFIRDLDQVNMKDLATKLGLALQAAFGVSEGN